MDSVHRHAAPYFRVGLDGLFRKLNQSVGYLIFTQILISIGGSIFIIVEQISILTAVDHQQVAAALAILNTIGTIGDALGANISVAIWTNKFLPALYRYLPSNALDDIDNIHEDWATQLIYAVGTPERLGLQKAYGYAQTIMLAVGTGIIGLSLIWILFIRTIELKKNPLK
ncbi:hypothetical protein F5Y16DRAFT_184540 [Xylariaceae sp. FL0255]|nr:hypothetical protein F5Y16DRAFT_184540 [Xylariaceae sp. FL0255]